MDKNKSLYLLGQWLIIYFKKVLTPLLWKIKKSCQNINCFFFLIKTFFIWIVNHCPKGIY